MIDGAPWADDLTEGVVLIADGRVVALNAAAAAMLRVDSARVRGRPLIEVLRDHRLERAWVDGTPARLETRGRHLEVRPTAEGLLLRDVTDEARARDDARELLAVLSHELRTPVTTVRSALEALASDAPPDLKARFLATATEESERLIRLLEDLTVETRPPRARRVELGLLVDRAAELLADTFAAHRTSLETELASTTAWADPDKVLQVLLNLLENASIHGPDDAEVRLRSRADAATDTVLIEVSDAGPPLAPAVRAALFRPHAQGSAAARRGTGLGLYIVRSIAERSGGAADVRREDDRNVFWVRLPRAAPTRAVPRSR